MDNESLKNQAASVLSWIVDNRVVGENGQLMEFDNHKFLAMPYADLTPKQAIRKSAQIGWSTLAIIKSFHLALFAGTNIIYTLPTKSVVKDFVQPKVNPLIEKNEVIKRSIGKTDSITLKKIGDRFIYFRSSWEEASAIMISADIVISDELDRSKPRTIATYASRLSASSFGWFWKFSNPSYPGMGVDEEWLKSDMKHWFVKCPHCGHYTYFDWLGPGELNQKRIHYVDFIKEEYCCGKCDKVIDNESRKNGRWIKKHLKREISGYWVSQMIAPWISAKSIIDEYENNKGNMPYFYNFVLGKPYQEKDLSVDRQTIIDCIVPTKNNHYGVAMGVDNGVVKTYVIGNKQGIFEIGETEDWDEVERLRNRFNAYMVIDANPYPTHPKKLTVKYPGKVYIHYYQTDRKASEVTRWGLKEKRRVVVSDRTKLLDLVVDELNNQEIIFNMTEHRLEDYIVHWKNMYRVVELDSLGVMKGKWKTPEGKPDHFAHATALWRVAMEKAQAATGTGGVTPPPVRRKFGKEAVVISKDNTIPGIDIKKAARATVMPKRSWRKV